MSLPRSVCAALESQNAFEFCYYLNSEPALASLNQTSNITVFAFTEAAFRRGNTVAAHTSELIATMQYHFVHGVHTSEAIGDRTLNGERQVMYTMLETFVEDGKWENVTGGQKVGASRGDTSFSLQTGSSRATIETPDILFEGGIIHMVDTVLRMPTRAGEQIRALKDPTLTEYTDRAKILLEALEITGLLDEIEALSDVTILVPYDLSFYQIGSIFDGMTLDELTRILKYHVIVGNVTCAETISQSDPSWSLHPLTLANLTVNITHSQEGLNSLEFDGLASMTDSLIANGNLISIDEVLDPKRPTGVKYPEAKKVPVGQPLFTNIITQTKPSNTGTTSRRGFLSTGAKIGIGFGSALGGVVLLMLIAWMIWRRRRGMKILSIQASEDRELDSILVEADAARIYLEIDDANSIRPELEGVTVGSELPDDHRHELA